MPDVLPKLLALLKNRRLAGSKREDYFSDPLTTVGVNIAVIIVM